MGIKEKLRMKLNWKDNYKYAIKYGIYEQYYIFILENIYYQLLNIKRNHFVIL